MSEATAAGLTADTSREQSYFEQQIFSRSPVGIVPTALVIFIMLFGGYLLLAELENIAAIQWHGLWPVFAPGAWPALVISLLIATALGMQRYVRIKEVGDFSAYAAILKDGAAGAREATAFIPDNAKLVRATLIGVVLGASITLFIFLREGAAMIRSAPMVFAWFFLTITILVVMFVRGVELTRKANTGFRAMLENDVRIDLLRIDALDVLGRASARAALVWFTISAVICLFFVDGGNTITAIFTLAACAAMGLWIFTRNMQRVHALIGVAKRTELERIRGELDRVRGQMHGEASASVRMQGLLAYEARIAAAPEWPFDQSTLIRFGASALILTLPWFGQAVAASVVEHLGVH